MNTQLQTLKENIVLSLLKDSGLNNSDMNEILNEVRNDKNN